MSQATLELAVYGTYTFVLGAVVGSFLSMLVYRLPFQMPLLAPRFSACPACGHRLALRDNLPIVSWCVLRGRCRYCTESISWEYLAIELVTACLFGCLFWAYFFSGSVYGFPTAVPYMMGLQPEFHRIYLKESFLVFSVHLVLVASLIGSTWIDFRYYIIALPLPWFSSLFSLIVLPLSVAWWSPVLSREVVPWAEEAWCLPVFGAMVGLGLATWLDAMGWIPRSFPEPTDEQLKAQWDEVRREMEEEAAKQGKTLEDADVPFDSTGDEMPPPDFWYVDPYPRWEAMKETLFLLFPVLGAVLGLMVPAQAWLTLGYPDWLSVAVGVMRGYLVGGLIIWAIRLLGTFAFGKEAMGFGDVHLLASIGAVCGPLHAVVVMFYAVVLGMAMALLLPWIIAIMQHKSRVIPFGPSLAIGAYLVMAMHEPLVSLFVWLFAPLFPPEIAAAGRFPIGW